MVNDQIWGDNDKDTVKFTVLYLSHILLLGADDRNVINDYFLHLANDLDAFSW